MRKLKVGDVLTKVRHPITIDDETEYRQVTVRLKHQGVCLRGYKIGKDIGTKKQYIVRSGQFILSKIDARNGAFGIIPDDLDGAIVTNDFLTYEVNEKELNIELFELLTSQSVFDELCNMASTGTTNRKRLNEQKFLDQEIILPPIEEQDAFIAHFKKIQIAQEQMLSELQTQADLIAKLRSSILSDAVSGRLVPQDPTDEPASVLLERIKAEKERLVKERKIKKEKPVTSLVEFKVPFEIPDSWVWCQLADIGFVNPSNKEIEDTSSATFVEMSAIPISFLESNDGVEKQWAKIKRGLTHIQDGDVVLAKITPSFENGKSTVISGLKNSIGSATTELHVFRPIIDIDPKFVLSFFKSPHFLNEGESRMTGSAGQKRVPRDYVFGTYFPLPPLAEQHRIIAKVEKLMATCDALEAEIQKSRAETDRLMQTVLRESFNAC
jgi:type I restriction enzyme S subunit